MREDGADRMDKRRIPPAPRMPQREKPGRRFRSPRRLIGPGRQSRISALFQDHPCGWRQCRLPPPATPLYCGRRHQRPSRRPRNAWPDHSQSAARIAADWVSASGRFGLFGLRAAYAVSRYLHFRLRRSVPIANRSDGRLTTMRARQGWPADDAPYRAFGGPHASTKDAADHFLILSPIGEAHSRRAEFSADEMTAQQKVELDSSLFREEDPGPLQLHRRLRSGDRLSEPMRPLHRKVGVIGAPDDEGWRPQLAQLRLDHSRVLVVESHDEALQVARTLFAPYQRSEISLDVFVRDGL